MGFFSLPISCHLISWIGSTSWNSWVFQVANSQKQVDGLQIVLHLTEENTVIVCKHPL